MNNDKPLPTTTKRAFHCNPPLWQSFRDACTAVYGPHSVSKTLRVLMQLFVDIQARCGADTDAYMQQLINQFDDKEDE